MSQSPEIEVLDDPASLARRAAEHFRNEAGVRLSGTGRFTVALSGGSTPRRLYEELATGDGPPLPWDRIHLFWGDERHLPPDHPDSNYRMVKEALLDPAGIPGPSVHRVPTGSGTPEEVAAEYEAHIRDFFSSGPGEFPSLDLALLGLGPDGHTASLFPGSRLAAEEDRLVVAGYVDAVKGHRISLTFPILNAAGRVIFLASGSSKAEAVKRILEGVPPESVLPAAKVSPRSGRLTWLLDREAAGLLGPVS